MSAPDEPPEQPEAGGGATLHELMHQMRTGSDDKNVRPPEPPAAEQPPGRAPRVARKEPGRRVRERAAREERAEEVKKAQRPGRSAPPAPPEVPPAAPEAGTGPAPRRPEEVAAAAGMAPAMAPTVPVEPAKPAEADQGDQGVVARLAGRLAAMRDARDWSLQDLARRSGVSRSTLSRVERGQISPTAAVLVKLAAAYGQTLSGLLAEVEEQPRSLVRAAEQSVSGEDAWRRRVVSPPFPGLRGSVVDAQILPATDVVYDPPVDGAEQHLWLITGTLEVTLGAAKVGRSSHAAVPQPGDAGAGEGAGTAEQVGDFVLVRGDCLRLRLWGPARLRCLSPDPARYALVTVAP